MTSSRRCLLPARGDPRPPTGTPRGRFAGAETWRQATPLQNPRTQPD